VEEAEPSCTSFAAGYIACFTAGNANRSPMRRM